MKGWLGGIFFFNLDRMGGGAVKVKGWARVKSIKT